MEPCFEVAFWSCVSESQSGLMCYYTWVECLFEVLTKRNVFGTYVKKKVFIVDPMQLDNIKMEIFIKKQYYQKRFHFLPR